MITAEELTCLQYMCCHNIRFSGLSNCGMWVKASRRLTPGDNSQEFMAAARLVCPFKISLHCLYLLCPTFSLVIQQTTTVDYVTTAPSPCGSFKINAVLLKSTDGLEPVALWMEKTVIQAARSMKHESEGVEC